MTLNKNNDAFFKIVHRHDNLVDKSWLYMFDESIYMLQPATDLWKMLGNKSILAGHARLHRAIPQQNTQNVASWMLPNKRKPVNFFSCY